MLCSTHTKRVSNQQSCDCSTLGLRGSVVHGGECGFFSKFNEYRAVLICVFYGCIINAKYLCPPGVDPHTT